MSRKRHAPEQIISKLRQAEVEIANGAMIGQEGLEVPRKQPKRGRLWLNDGSSVRLRPAHVDHVWSYDFMLHRTHDGRALRLLTLMDEFSRECLAIDVARQLKADDVLDRLTWLFAQRGAPRYIRSDNGPEFTASKVRKWLRALSVNTRGVASATPKRLRQQSQFIEPGSPADLRSARKTATSSPSMARCGTSC